MLMQNCLSVLGVGGGGGEAGHTQTKCIMGDVEMANSLLCDDIT